MRSLPVPLDHGRIVVDRYLRVQGMDDVWALGDNAHIPLGDPSAVNTAYAPPLAQFAFREARVLANNIAAHLDGRPMTAFEYRSLGTMAALGGRTGVADILGVRVTGFLAWAAWRLFYLSLLPGLSTRVRVTIDWMLDLFVSRSIVEIRPSHSDSNYIPILKERLFGLTNAEGNHGEDVKELYYYLDATPTYSYARMLYKYPQAAYPYAWLVAENGSRTRQQPEFEILDTGIFDEDRYFDVDIEYAKADVNDFLMRITVTNRGPEAAQITLLPQVWFRNTWNWFEDAEKPSLKAVDTSAIGVEHGTLGSFTIFFDQPQDLLFCDNEIERAEAVRRNRCGQGGTGQGRRSAVE